MTPPRTVAPWADYFMALAVAVSERSKDPSTQHGSVVVDQNRLVIGTGYNGGPRGVDDRAIDWTRPAKYGWVIHSEENSLWMAVRHVPLNADLAGCTMYVTGPPCSRCMLRIVHSGLRRVVYGGKGSVCVDEADWLLASRIAEAAGCRLCKWEPGVISCVS